MKKYAKETNNVKQTLTNIKDYLKTTKDLSQLLTGNGSFINCYNPKTHRIHGRVNTLGANTGRMTHNKPNITQLSKDKSFRELLTVPKGKFLLDVDADQLELVMMGHYLGPFDNYKYAKIVDKGDKSKGTDIHTVNQKNAKLETRDQAKTMIYATIYGAGSTRVGQMLCSDTSSLDYSHREIKEEELKLLDKVITLNDKKYYPIDKDTLVPFDKNLILKSIYGKNAQQQFKANTLGYNELYAYLTDLANQDNLYGLDGRKLFIRASYQAFNLTLQSAGAIYMKHLLVNIDKQLSNLWTHGKEYAYVANIHDAINIEIIPEIKDEISDIIKKSFPKTSYNLGMKYPVYGEPSIGLNQWETH